MDKKALLETAKEGLRLALFAALGALVDYALVKIGDVQGLDPIIILVVTYALRLIDKYIHENPAIKLNGLSPI